MTTHSGKFIATAFALLLACTATPSWAQSKPTAPQEAGAAAGAPAPQQGAVAPSGNQKAPNIDSKAAGGKSSQNVQNVQAQQPQAEETQQTEAANSADASDDYLNYQDSEAAAAEAQATPAQTPTPQAPPQEQASSSTPLLVAFLALILAAIALYLTVKKQGGKGGKKPNPIPTDPKPDVSVQLAQVKATCSEQGKEISALKDTVSMLESRIKLLESKLQTLVDGGNRGGGKEEKSPGRAYASLPQNGLIAASDLTEKASKECFIEIETQGNTATFAFATDESIQRYLLANFNFTVKDICTVKSRVDAPTRIVTNVRGKMRKEGNSWKITDNPVIALV